MLESKIRLQFSVKAIDNRRNIHLFYYFVQGFLSIPRKVFP